ncbi:uncharacterized protein FOMMEDRAFT_133719 [Fomitiporia mediterranea MF3/22]|uniref:uncharacterized protein n=1 Tax=Fomitiporia mediterranea (strain MF3/22) TaxID=694068 RepID=UPI0004408FB6|nr:uncharacterized protein FOMMEDRAFT_133719 [Fomitiporia mediterranea MF3/22]EJD04448.1 hypothetical protein FOMMEDRAFT_133719 [Fomitiporia mediterranea MF3/22]
MSDFPALPGFYKLMYLHLEPISTIAPSFFVWLFPGTAWFYGELIPGAPPVKEDSMDPRATMAIWQLTNCYLLLGLISSLVFRAVRDALPHDPVAQERIVGASLMALAIADVSCIMIATWIGLPPELRYDPLSWNSVTHGSITTVIILLSGRLAWFAGIGRKRYYYGQKLVKKED